MSPGPRNTTDWTKFEVADDDLDFIYNLLLDREIPLTTEEMASPLLEHRLQRAASFEVETPVAPERAIYLPAEEYRVGQELVFPKLGNQVGTVVGVRPGDNPEIGLFDVIEVEFEGDGQRREFAARLQDHRLNRVPEPVVEAQTADTPETILQLHGKVILSRLEARLSQKDDIVRIAGRWFPRALLADINTGHLNLAEAVLDVGGGGPLPTTALLEHVDLPSSLDPLLAAFSLDYALQEDERFDEVGPAGQVLWYLKRLEPPEVLVTPPRLTYAEPPHNRLALSPDLLRLERELDDEFSPLEGPAEPEDEVVLGLLFPHWRVGALPLNSRLRPLFPTAYEAPRIRFLLIDGHNGDEFPGWVVRKERYVTGLNEWYRRHDVPAGGLIRVFRGKRSGEVVVEAVDRRRRNDWIRTVSISADNQIGFTMLKQPVGTSYDDRMIVGLLDQTALDEAWLKGEQRRMPLERLIAFVFRELAKLNPQSAVHAQSLYSGVNVLRRLAPAPIFAELVTRPYYVHVGDLYWRFDESAWTSS